MHRRLSVEMVASRGPHLRDSLSSLLGPSRAQNFKSVALAVAPRQQLTVCCIVTIFSSCVIVTFVEVLHL